MAHDSHLNRAFTFGVIESQCSKKVCPIDSDTPKCRPRTSSNGKVFGTRGQWTYRPAATRAMRKWHVMIYDLNYFNLTKYVTYAF